MRRILFFLLLCQTAFGQTAESVGVSITLPSIALLDVGPNSGGFNLNLTAPTEAGLPQTITATNNSKWLSFTSAVATGVTRSINVQISGSLPTGLNLKLATANYSGKGAGRLGSPISAVNLSNALQTVVSNIGGAYTGIGVGNGYNLTYSLEIADYSLLRNQTTTLSILYTLTDN